MICLLIVLVVILFMCAAQLLLLLFFFLLRVKSSDFESISLDECQFFVVEDKTNKKEIEIGR